jgi:hypothetical protein
VSYLCRDGSSGFARCLHISSATLFPLPSRPRRAFYLVMLKPQPARASCQNGFPSGASVFRFARTLRCRSAAVSRGFGRTPVEAPIGGATNEKGIVWD